MQKAMKKFLLDDTGLELSEYAVAAALVAIAVAGAFTALGDAIGLKLNQLAARVGG
jgi:Flp pilus assembly pilin Flp